MEAANLVVHLRRNGIQVHHAARTGALLNGLPSAVVFLDGNQSQADLARDLVLELAEVSRVTFARNTKAVMYVHGITS